MDASDNSQPIQISPGDRDIAIRTMLGEEGSPEGQAGVASVMLNRAQSGKYGGNTLTDVALAPGQFEPWSTRPKDLLSIQQSDPRYQQAGKILDSVASGETPDFTNGATHFYAPAAQKALGRPTPAWASGNGTSLGQSLFYSPQGPVHYAAPAAQAIQVATTTDKSKKASPSAEPDIVDMYTKPMPSSPAPTIHGSLAIEPAAGAAVSSEPDIVDQYTKPMPNAAATTGPGAARMAGAVPGPNGLVWNATGGFDPTSGELVVAGKPPQAIAPTQGRAAVAGFLNGVPIAGPSLVSGAERLGAGLRNLISGDPYDQTVSAQQGAADASMAAYPKTATAMGVAGGVAGLAPAMVMAPAAFGAGGAGLVANTLTGAATGAGIGAADSVARNGLTLPNAITGATLGGIGGAAGPLVGAGVGKAISGISNLFNRTTPGAANVANMLRDAGTAPMQAEAELARNPNLTLADLSPSFTTDAGALASQGGTPTEILKSAMKARAAGADDRMSQIVNESLGPKPDAEGILNQIRNREVSNNVDTSTARAALDNSMGQAADPHAVLTTMIAQRSAAAQPLYEKALDRPVVWDNRLQQFLDDPIVQSGLSKGVRIQRLESLADPNAKPFNPTDYAIKDFDAAGDPIIGTTPNMRTLNVVKKGLDSMVGDAQDPVTGKLSEEGRAIDGVRRSFLNKLDQINPDYAAARQAWAGPTVTQDAFNRGLNLFRNQSGSSGVSSTPGALNAWVNNPATSDGEKEAAKIGARTAFEQQMASSNDPAAKAALLANKQANQQKLASVLGPDEANSLVKQLTFKYEDPVGAAFNKGLDIFKSRQGAEGIGDSPDSLKSWLKNADPSEIAAHQQGARQAIEQSLSSARQGDFSAARSLFAKSTANRDKLEAVFPNAKKMLDGLSDELNMRATEQGVAGGSATAERTAAAGKYRPASGGPEINPAIPLLGEAVGGAPLAAAATGAKMIYGNLHNAFTEAARQRLMEGTARGLVSTGPEQSKFMGQVGRAFTAAPMTKGLADTGGIATNLLARPLIQQQSRNLFGVPQ
jgi:hypothetical protein